MPTLEHELREIDVRPIGQPYRDPGVRRAVCPRCVCERWVTDDGRFAYHNDDNGHQCNGSRAVVRT
jgi:hypothetical protein